MPGGNSNLYADVKDFSKIEAEYMKSDRASSQPPVAVSSSILSGAGPEGQVKTWCKRRRFDEHHKTQMLAAGEQPLALDAEPAFVNGLYSHGWARWVS